MTGLFGWLGQRWSQELRQLCMQRYPRRDRRSARAIAIDELKALSSRSVRIRLTFFSDKTTAAPNMGVVLGISLNGLACSGNLKRLRPRAGEKFSSNQGNKELNSFANNETRTQARSQSDGRANRPRQIRRLGEQARRQRLHGLRQAVRLDLL